MKIRLKRMWMNRPKGTELDISEGLAQQMIQRGAAEAITDEKPKKKTKKKPGRPKEKKMEDTEQNKQMTGSPVEK